jgi:hypothetical protein
MTNNKDDWATEVASKLSHGVAVTSAGSFLYYELDEVVAVLIKSRADGEAVGELRGRIKGLREAEKAASESCWKHAGEDAYSRGMDAGAIHQAKACVEAIRELADKLEKGET